MKNIKFSRLVIVFLILAGTAGTAPMFTQTQEYIEVINVQLILRAWKDGKPLSGLKQGDITLYEDGKPITLTSFQEIRRKVGTVGTQENRKPRLFFLYFRAVEPDPRLREALDFFFKRVYRDGDYVLLLFRNRAYPITDRPRIAPVLETFNTAMTQALNTSRLEKQRLYDALERYIKAYLDEMSKNESNSFLNDTALMQLLSNFKTAWQQYRIDNITLEQAKLKSIAASLKKVDLEKWGFVFYQQDNLPQLNLKSIFRMRKTAPTGISTLRKELEIIARDMNQTGYDSKTINELKNTFIQSDITLHVLLSTPVSRGKLQSTYLQPVAAQTDWQQVFRNISQASGGEVAVDNNLRDSMVKAVARQDVYYRLTYAPVSRAKTQRKIRIETGLPDIKLQFHRKVTVALPEAEKLAISNFNFKHPVLKFTLSKYRRLFDGARMLGDVEVKITAVHKQGKMINFKRSFQPDNQETAVSMNLNFPDGGQYSLIVEALDRRTQKKTIFSQKISVPHDKYMLEPVLVSESQGEISGVDATRTLNKLLEKSAIYCQRLQKTAFYFTCTEEVTDNYWLRGSKVKEKHYLYDYQIIREKNGKMNETRKIKTTLPAGKKKILTNFVSSYPYLMPIGMLAEKNRGNYRYRLTGKESIDGRQYFKVSVEPKEDGVMLKDSNYGTVWIDEKDGSVIKIKINPNSLGGIDGLKHLARQKRNRLKVTDIHKYEILRNGVRFPSKTRISCEFFDWDSVKRVQNRFNVNALEQVETLFQYKNYRFFNVAADVVESGHQ